jgi:hypothetical protein
MDMESGHRSDEGSDEGSQSSQTPTYLPFATITLRQGISGAYHPGDLIGFSGQTSQCPLATQENQPFSTMINNSNISMGSSRLIYIQLVAMEEL